MIKSHFLNQEYKELELDFDSNRKALWFYMKGEPVPCFTVNLLKELNSLFDSIKQTNNTRRQINYLVAASGKKGIYNLGGDLKLFRHCVETRDRDTLRAYAYSCLDLGFECTSMLDQDITTIALIEGNALGGGLELRCPAMLWWLKKMYAWDFLKYSLICFPAWVPIPTCGIVSTLVRSKRY